MRGLSMSSLACALLVLTACDRGAVESDAAAKAGEQSNAVAPPTPGAAQPGSNAAAPQVNVNMGADAEVTRDDAGTVVRDGAGNEVQTGEHGSVIKGADGSKIVTDEAGNMTIEAGGKSIAIDAEGNVKMK